MFTVFTFKIHNLCEEGAVKLLKLIILLCGFVCVYCQWGSVIHSFFIMVVFGPQIDEWVGFYFLAGC